MHVSRITGFYGEACDIEGLQNLQLNLNELNLGEFQLLKKSKQLSFQRRKMQPPDWLEDWTVGNA